MRVLERPRLQRSRCCGAGCSKKRWFGAHQNVIRYTSEQTVQYEGQAEELNPPELEQYQKIYFMAWPDGRARMNWPETVYFVVRPTWIRYSDFDQDPPLIREFSLASGRGNPA